MWALGGLKCFGRLWALAWAWHQGATPALTPITLKPVYQPDLY